MPSSLTSIRAGGGRRGAVAPAGRRPSNGTRPSRQRGRSILELLAGLVVAAVILGAGAPFFSELLAESRLSTAASELTGSLSLARSEAVKLGTPVCVCASFDGVSCSGSTDWSLGWILFTDDNGNRSREPGDRLLRVQGQVPEDAQLVANRQFFAFLPDGSLAR